MERPDELCEMGDANLALGSTALAARTSVAKESSPCLLADSSACSDAASLESLVPDKRPDEADRRPSVRSALGQVA